MTWITIDNKIIASLEDMPEGVFGFIYEMHDLETGHKYIGRKQVLSERKKRFGKKRLAQMTDKRLKPYEIVTKESDWSTYMSSSKKLLEAVKNGHRINRTILEFTFSKAHTTYSEVKWQFIKGVLENDEYLNDSILGKFYRIIFNFKNEK